MYNNFMSENKPYRGKNQNMKTENSILSKFGEVELGKPVRLPYIRKISTNSHNCNISRKSLEAKEARVMRNFNKQVEHFDQTQQSMLTLQQMELCNQKTKQKEGFPRISHANQLFGRERSIQSLDYTNKIRSQKSMTKIQFSEYLRDYKLGAVVGRGTYSIVRSARNKDHKKFAIKTYLKSSLSCQDRKVNLQYEIQILQKLSNPCILAYNETIETEESINIVTELFENRSLADWLKGECMRGIGEDNARTISRQLIKAIAYIHSLDIVHRDLKIDNILVNRDLKVKLIDFGFSRQLPRENYMLYDFCGTPHYIAPEVIHREGYFGKPADIWSLGIVIYKMTVGTFPFKGLNQKTLFSKVMKGQLKIPPEISPQLAVILERMLSFDFRKRPLAEELTKNQWFSG